MWSLSQFSVSDYLSTDHDAVAQCIGSMLSARSVHGKLMFENVEIHGLDKASVS